MSTILAIGYSSEPTFKYFTDKVSSSNKLNIRIFDLYQITIAQKIRIIEDSFNLQIIIDDEVFNFSDFFGFYNRCYYSQIGDTQKNYALSKIVSSINAFLENTNRTVLNKHSSCSSNGNKYAHISELREYGFLTPSTSILGDSSYLKPINKKVKLVNKSCSGIKTIASVVDDSLYSKKDRLNSCPSLFQELIEGYDVRIHLIGNKAFGEKIVSDVLDYRFNKKGINKFTEIEIPKDILDKCIDYCSKNSLIFSGIDFKVKNEEWYILEVNPMPGYEGYDMRSNGAITNEIISFFMNQEKNTISNEDYFFIANNRRPDIQGL